MATDASPAAAPDDGFALPFADTDGTDPGPTLLPDTVLLESVRGGSQAAFARLYDRHVDIVYRASLRVNSDRSVAAEVVQETFLALWDRAEMFDPSRGTLASWLATIARNRAVDHLRRAARRPATTFSSFGLADTDDASTVEWLARTGSLVAASGAERTPEQALADVETRAALDEALASIAPSERQVIDLAYRAGLSQTEIAARLNWPLGTVKTRTRRALRQLRERLEAADDPAGTGSRTGRPASDAAARGAAAREAAARATEPRPASSGGHLCGSAT
jgi:RNA polymerase sigma-70 factor (ECF subfamily)